MNVDTITLLKKLVRDPVFVVEMKAVFFEAMMAGYASTEKIVKSSIAELPGSKLIPPYVKGPWKVSDPYLVNVPLSSYSGGMTIISYESVPVWAMQYFGRYDEVGVHCLKAALRDTYSRKVFCGGRGERDFEYGIYHYWNDPLPHFGGSIGRLDIFNSFAGREQVTDGATGTTIGWHSYQGGAMF